MKLCKCGEPISKGSKTRCKSCDAEYKWYYNQEVRFGLKRSDLDRMWQEQGGACKICFQPFIGKRPAVDHCHSTNKVRGLLCLKCNTALGLMGDNVHNLQNAITYLNDSLRKTTSA